MTTITKTTTITQYILDEQELEFCIDALDAKSNDIYDDLNYSSYSREEEVDMAMTAEAYENLADSMRRALHNARNNT